ncbi:MAG: hypothetical protein ACT4PL_03745 [Phycisphaerales bacterium]
MVLISGCNTPSYNRELTLGNRVELEAVTDGVPRGSPVATPERPDRPSLARDVLARDWQARRFLVPIDGVTHRPTYTERQNEVAMTRRDRGEFPTPESALDTSVKGGVAAQFAQAAGSIVRVPAEIAMMPVRMYESPPFDAVSSPSTPPERYNYPGGQGRMSSNTFPPSPPAAAKPSPEPAAATGEAPSAPVPALPPLPAAAPTTAENPAKPGESPNSELIWIYDNGRWRQIRKSEAPPR